jgi:hypothetical protein
MAAGGDRGRDACAGRRESQAGVVLLALLAVHITIYDLLYDVVGEADGQCVAVDCGHRAIAEHWV